MGRHPLDVEQGHAGGPQLIDEGDELVGGLYGVRIGRMFAGESMFHSRRDASKVALVALVAHLRATGAVLLDVQWTTEHLVSLGAVDVPRTEYLRRLADALAARASSTGGYQAVTIPG